GGIVDSLHFVGSEADDAINASHDIAIGATLTDTVLGVAFVPVTVPGFESINIHGNAGNDSLTVDNSMGLVFPEGNIFYDGGTGRDSLTLAGTTAVDTDTYNVGPSAGAGSDVQTLGG